MVMTPVPPTPVTMIPYGRSRPGERRLGQHWERGAVARHPGALAQGTAVHGDEARAEPLDAGEVLVARGLVDGALAPEPGLERHHRDAVRLHPAVAAPLAYRGVDEGAPGRVGVLPALAPAALLRRAGLVVDEDGDPGDVAQAALHRVELAPVVHGGSGGEPRPRPVLLRLVGDHHDAARALGLHLPGDDRHRERAVHRLAAGHRHRVVVEDLERDVDVRRDRGPDRQQPRVEVRPVPDVLEDVPALAELRFPDPARALPAHVGVAGGGPVHELGEVVAADARERPAALRDPGRGVVGAPRTEVRGAHERRGVRVAAAQDGLQLRDARRNRGREGRIAAARQEPAADLDRDVVGVEPARGGEQRPVRLVALAENARRTRHRVQHVLELGLDEGALLLDDEDGLQPLGEAPRPLGLQRKRHRHLVEPDPEPARRLFVDAEILERLPNVKIGLAGGRDPEPRPVRVPHRAVEAVGAAERLDGFQLPFVEPHLLLLGRVRPADSQTLRGDHGHVGEDDCDPPRIDLHRGGGLDGVVDALQRGQQPL